MEVCGECAAESVCLVCRKEGRLQSIHAFIHLARSLPLSVRFDLYVKDHTQTHTYHVIESLFFTHLPIESQLRDEGILHISLLAQRLSQHGGLVLHCTTQERGGGGESGGGLLPYMISMMYCVRVSVGG